jgi:hypothetical protein
VTIDDFYERRCESIDYLNRRQDRLDFEDGLARRRDTVSEAIRKKDYSRAVSEFGIDPSWSSDADAHESVKPGTRGRQRTAFGQFLAHTTRLIIHLESSRFLPNRVARQWIKRIKQVDIFQPSNGLLELDALYTDYLYIADEYKPQRDVFDLAAAGSMEFDREMHNIRYELDWIKAILKHVEV